jgi:hypothetical protein
MTLHSLHNYGSALQALALQEVLQTRCGVRAEIIDYLHNGVGPVSDAAVHLLYSPVPDTLLRYRRAREQYRSEAERRSAAFEAFSHAHMRLSRRYASAQELREDPPQYDIYLSGGDQIWNFAWDYNGSLMPYFLSFTNSPNKIAYGCGMFRDAAEPFPIEFRFLPALEAYRKIMVRERWGAESLTRYLNQDIEVVLDASLLFCARDYQPYIKRPRMVAAEPYIFAYFLAVEDNGRLAETLGALARRSGKRVILVSSDIPINTDCVSTVMDAGPAEWLWLVQNADAVATNSFHGAALSIVFEKPFFSIGADARKRALLEPLGLASRTLGMLDALKGQADFSLDYTAASARLARERGRSVALLQHALDLCKQVGET